VTSLGVLLGVIRRIIWEVVVILLSLLRCTATEMRCNRKYASLGSDVTLDSLRPNSLMKLGPSKLFQGPRASTATEWYQLKCSITLMVSLKCVVNVVSVVSVVNVARLQSSKCIAKIYFGVRH